MVLGKLGKSLRTPRGIALLAVALLALGSVVVWRFGERYYTRLLLESPRSGKCERRLTRAVLGRSLELGTAYLLEHQKPEGNFDYEYDWRKDSLSAEDNETRQAGALWGLSSIYLAKKTPELRAATERGLGFFEAHSQVAGDRRCTAYAANRVGNVGTVALVALAEIEYLRALPADAADASAHHRELLGQYLRMLKDSAHPSRLWHGNYEVKTCKPVGEPSPYTDGEALLALIKAAKFLDHRELVPDILRGAAAGKRLNIDRARAENPDSDTTKSYYQWASMAFFELQTSEFAPSTDYGAAVLELADWIIDEHHILTRNRNTGYAFEGLAVAYALAKQRGDQARVAKLGCVIDVGLEHLLSWQVAGPTPNRYTEAPGAPRKAIGGVQNAAFESPLRIDVTQHQMHATELALEYVY
jgi:UDP-N-acetylmuramoyl-tripeptide--D-alanyl-D-alanine ligase